MSNSDEQVELFDLHLTIGPTIVAGSPLLRRLDVAGAFDMNASQSRLYPPVQQVLATEWGRALRSRIARILHRGHVAAVGPHRWRDTVQCRGMRPRLHGQWVL